MYHASLVGLNKGEVLRSPAQLTMRRLRKEGFQCEFTQHWNHYSKRSQDLLGFVDVLAFGYLGGTLAVQSTSWSNISARVKKILASDKYAWAHQAGWFVQVEGWKLNKSRKYISKIVEL